MAKENRRAKDTPTAPRLEDVKIATLVPYPDQELYFPSSLYDRDTYRSLVASIKATGVETPLIVLPPGNAAGLKGYTIVAGHTRAKAARDAGLTTVPATVRYDLLGATRGEVNRLFLEDNTRRRQLGPLARARAAVGIYLARRGMSARPRYGSVFEDGALREEVAKILDMSGRNLARYLNVLDAPVEVQTALEAGRVRLVDAARVAALPPEDRDRLAARLRAGEDARAVFAEFFPPGDGRHVKPADAVAAFARALAAAGADLAGRVDRVRPAHVRRNAAALNDGMALIALLLGRLEGAGGPPAAGV